MATPKLKVVEPPRPDWSRLKLPLVWVPSDDFEIELNSETVAPRAGEKVGIAARRTIGQLYALEGLKIRDGEDRREWLGRAWEGLTNGYIVAWTWTDDFGEPLPPPAECSQELLTEDELVYLWGVVLHRGQPPKAPPAPAADPNPSGGSPTG